jgi:hypothetical protein
LKWLFRSQQVSWKILLIQVNLLCPPKLPIVPIVPFYQKKKKIQVLGMWLNDIAPSLYEALDFIPNVKEKVFRLSKDQN